ncbi:transcriptional regulator [Rhodococcus sp. ACS1]|uniref:Polyketide cyclase / dehydrase and lipid transport n=2 Tax=Rhodococcus TaxID=1827 RepID=A0A1H4Q0U4_9NOCA|nr:MULTISPECIES: SRPBCC family protein [Rhodococcus]PBC50693.1 transcriptional regulator [Rhodococcus sp. ACS1]SEC13072.1 Polyketide cyclase / dehydrase and lipid transport [Rhodococcus koreensis]
MASAEFLVERSTVIDASPDVVQPLLDDFRKWQAWSPWEDVDPDLKRTYSGPDSGVGASYAWEGNRKAGSGQMVITESVPGSKVVLDLTFLKPFKAENVTTFLLEPNGAGTTVRWQMTGKNNLFFRIVGVVFPMDKMVGKDFEKGLAQLKAAAEQRQ